MLAREGKCSVIIKTVQDLLLGMSEVLLLKTSLYVSVEPGLCVYRRISALHTRKGCEDDACFVCRTGVSRSKSQR